MKNSVGCIFNDATQVSKPSFFAISTAFPKSLLVSGFCGKNYSLSKEELIDYMMKILQENPELLAAEIETTEEKNEGSAVELEGLIDKYRKMADRCFYVSTDNLYRAAGEVAQNLNTLLGKNRTLVDRDKIAAAALFTAVFESIDDNYSEVDDSNGILGGISWDCKKVLGGILPGANLNTTERQKWL